MNSLIPNAITCELSPSTHLSHLLHSGWTINEVCEEAGISVRDARNILAGRLRCEHTGAVRGYAGHKILEICPDMKRSGKQVSLSHALFRQKVKWLTENGVTMSEITMISGISLSVLTQSSYIKAKTAKRFMECWDFLHSAAQIRSGNVFEVDMPAAKPAVTINIQNN